MLSWATGQTSLAERTGWLVDKSSAIAKIIGAVNIKVGIASIARQHTPVKLRSTHKLAAKASWPLAAVSRWVLEARQAVAGWQSELRWVLVILEDDQLSSEFMRHFIWLNHRLGANNGTLYWQVHSDKDQPVNQRILAADLAWVPASKDRVFFYAPVARIEFDSDQRGAECRLEGVVSIVASGGAGALEHQEAR